MAKIFLTANQAPWVFSPGSPTLGDKKVFLEPEYSIWFFTTSQREFLGTWNRTDDLKGIWRIGARVASLTVDPIPVEPPNFPVEQWAGDPPALPPPSAKLNVKRISQTFAYPTSFVKGKPVDWEPLSTLVEAWGRLQVVFDGIDVTFFRGALTQVQSWRSDEPFDDGPASFLFPQITPFDPAPSWARSLDPVELNLVRPNGTKKRIWEGFVSVESDSVTETEFGLRIECSGALYQLDHFLAKPPLVAREPRDLGVAIAEYLDQRACPGLRFSPLANIPTTGIMTNKYGAWDPVLTGFIQELLSTASTTEGSQWTLMKKTGRVPILKLKASPQSSIDWTVFVGQPGVTHDLSKNHSESENVYYGEGVDEQNCRWRNAVYPNLHPDSAPVFGGAIMNPGFVGEDFRLFANRILPQGYGLNDDNAYTADEEGEVQRFQGDHGIQVDGAVGPQTWAAAFEPGIGGSLDGAFFWPLAVGLAAMPTLRGGEINPGYVFSYPRIERYDNYGSKISKGFSQLSAGMQLSKFNPTDYKGKITLKADPQEGSRFEMKAGQNIHFKGYRGSEDGEKFHIVGCDVDWDGQSVTLEVDGLMRDSLTWAEMQERNRSNGTPSWRKDKKYRNSQRVEDQVATWDCENGSGIIPRHATYRGLWNTLRVPTAAGGEIIRAEFQLDIPAKFVVGVFDRPTTANVLNTYGAPLGEGFWDGFGDGLIIAWGGEGQAAGYSPGSESDESPLTGALIDDASWYYESASPPWLWVCIWVESPQVNYISGRFFPGVF